MSFPRYERYKESGVEWLGEVPEHWGVERLKVVANVFPSNVDKKEYEDEIPVRLCNYTDVYYNDIITDDMEMMKATASSQQIEKFTLRAGDVILTKDSETADDIAKSAYVPADLPGIVCGYHLSIARTRSSMDGAYLKRVFDSHAIRAQAEVSANGLTRFGLSKSALDNIHVPVPSSEEQRQITQFLDRETAKIDALIEEQRRLIALLKDKRQAVISHAVTKGLNPSALMKDSGVEWIGSVPKHWRIARMAEIFAEVQELGEEGLPILSVSIHTGVSDRELDESEVERTVNRSEDVSKYKRVAPGDLTYNMMRAWQGGFGAVAVDGMVSPAYVVARPRFQISTVFLEKLLRTPRAIEEMRRHSKGVTDFRLRLYWDEFKNIRIALPDPDGIRLILASIELLEKKTDALIGTSERGISLLQERRSALISAAVTGKIDVRAQVAKPVVAANPYSTGFARQLLAAAILDRTCQYKTTGRVKLQKLFHLCEHHAQIPEIHGNYQRQAAGPFDPQAMDEIRNGLLQQRWFEEYKDGDGYRYRALEKAGGHKQYLPNWADKKVRIDQILNLLGDATTERCGIVSTLYAAWNDLLLEGKAPTDAEIIYDASSAKRWHESKEKIAADKWPKELKWMRKNGLVPVGYGSHTTHQSDLFQGDANEPA